MPEELAINVGTVVETAGNLGALGLVGWLVRHTFAHTIPRLAKDFTESLEKQRKEFLDELAKQRLGFSQELTQMRAETHQERVECMHRLEAMRKELVILSEVVKASR